MYKLENDQGAVIGYYNLKRNITTYYKELFGQPESVEISLREDQILDIPQVSPKENDILISPFTESNLK